MCCIGLLLGFRVQATHCNTLQRTATHCNTMRHNATHCTEILKGKQYSHRCRLVCLHQCTSQRGMSFACTTTVCYAYNTMRTLRACVLQHAATGRIQVLYAYTTFSIECSSLLHHLALSCRMHPKLILLYCRVQICMCVCVCVCVCACARAFRGREL